MPTGVGDSAEAVNFYLSVFAGRADIDLTILKLFTQPSVPDVRAHLLEQDVVLVEGGSVVNLMAVWRAHGLTEILRECWEAGVVLAGASAGSLCWHRGGPTDSFGDQLARRSLTDSAWCHSATASTTTSPISPGAASTGT